MRMKLECGCNEGPSCEGCQGPAQVGIGGRLFLAVLGVCLLHYHHHAPPQPMGQRVHQPPRKDAGLLIRGGQALNEPFIYLLESVTWGT